MIQLCFHLPIPYFVTYPKDQLFSFLIPYFHLVYLSSLLLIILYSLAQSSASLNNFHIHFFILACIFMTFLVNHYIFYLIYQFQFFILLFLFVNSFYLLSVYQSHCPCFLASAKYNQAPNLLIESYFQAILAMS